MVLPLACDSYVASFPVSPPGGGTATYTTHWLDTIKVKMQTFPTDYRSGASCLRHTLREEGLRGLYQGVAPAVLSQVSLTPETFGFCCFYLLVFCCLYNLLELIKGENPFKVAWSDDI